MNSDLPPNGARNAWQAQSQEVEKMTLEDTRRAAARFREKVQRRSLIEYAGCAITVAGFAWFAWNSTSVIARSGHLLVLAGLLFVALKLRSALPAALPGPEFGRLHAIEFHRAALRRQLHVYEQAWLWLVALVPGLTLLMVGASKAGAETQPPGGPYLMPLVVMSGWVFLLALVRKRNQARAETLRSEIERLTQAEREP